MELFSATTIITCHSNADWDALAAMVGLNILHPDATLLFPGSMEKTVTSFFEDGISPLYLCRTAKEIDPASVRHIVIVDTQLFSRVPHILEFLQLPGVTVEIWDHHPVLQKGGTCILPQDNNIQPQNSREQASGTAEKQNAEHAPVRGASASAASAEDNGPNEVPTGDVIPTPNRHLCNWGSTCTLICQELRQRGITPRCQEATILGLGIYGDTGAFTFCSVCREDFLAAAWLRSCGMDVQQIAEFVNTGLTSNHIRLLNALLDSASVHEIGASKVVLASVALDEFADNFAYVVQRFVEMEHCDTFFALAEMDDKVQIVARSNDKAIDVGSICKAFGGGGHRYAASASVKNIPLPELKNAIFNELYTQVHPEKRARDIMSSPAVGIEENVPIREAETIMNRYGLKAAPIYRRGTRHCIGYIECQTASRAVSHQLGDVATGEYMQRTVLTVPPDAPLQRLMAIIVGAHQRLVPVVEKNTVIGVVTRTDFINMFVDDPASLPIASTSGKRERNLGKMLCSRLPSSMLSVMRRAGELGDVLGVSVYVVGGLVRDILLGRNAADSDDIDLVVEGNGIDFAHKFAEKLGGRVREHQAFMTALILYPGSDGKENRIDVATARLEYYKYPAALPTIELSSIKMDLFRRDFTINAMAIRLNSAQFGNLVDFFGGQGDIQRKSIRVIHALSFVEDPTRIIRAVRFEQRYGFHISLQGIKLIKNALALNLVEKLTGTRILHELELIFREKAPFNCLQSLNKMGVLKAIHPALALNGDKTRLLQEIGKVIGWYRMLYLKENPNLTTLYMLALCCAVSRRDTENICQRLGLSPILRGDLLKLRDTIRTAMIHLRKWGKEKNGQNSRLYEILSPVPLDGLLYIMARTPESATHGNVSQFIYKWRQIKVEINGQDLAQMGLEPGPAYGRIMRRVLAARLDGLAVTREEQLQLASNLIQEEHSSS